MKIFTVFVLLWCYAGAAKLDVCEEKRYKIVCYLASWSIYREGNGAFKFEHIIPSYCTHLIYTFAGLTIDGGIDSLDPYNDITGNKGFQNFIGLKDDNPCLKLLLAVGGWNEGAEKYSLMAETDETRFKFADHLMRFIIHYGFDGVDLDWEYPTTRGGLPEDRENFVLLLQTIKDKFRRRQKILSVALGAARTLLARAYDLPAICGIVDVINIMGYDYNDPAKATVHAPLFKDGSTNTDSIDDAIAEFKRAGCDLYKLVLGIPTFGKIYTLKDNDQSYIGAAVQGPGKPGKYTKSSGFLGYNEICELTLEGGWTTKYLTLNAVKVSFKGDQWVSYDDAVTVSQKANYVIDNKLGGVMFWTVDTDDFQGACFNIAYPLIVSANNVFGYNNSVKRAEHFKGIVPTFYL